MTYVCDGTPAQPTKRTISKHPRVYLAPNAHGFCVCPYCGRILKNKLNTEKEASNQIEEPSNNIQK